MTSLETLVMRDCRSFGREQVAALAGLQGLRTLDLSGTISRYWLTDDPDADIGCLAGLASLTSLKLNGVNFVWLPEDLDALCRLSRLTGLTSLDLRNLYGQAWYDRRTVSSNARAVLSTALPNLTDLLV
jgi:Leucine-rich repeat (LRR) protein